MEPRKEWMAVLVLLDLSYLSVPRGLDTTRWV